MSLPFRATRRRLTLLAVAFVAWTCSHGDSPTAPRFTVASIRVARDSVTLTAGDSYALRAAALDAVGATVPAAVAWRSDAPSLASTTADGLVTALGSGTATMTGSAGGVEAHVVVRVLAAPTATELSAGRDTMRTLGRTRSYGVVARAGDAVVPGRLTAWSDDTTVVAARYAVDRDSVLVTARRPGTARVIVREERGSADTMVVVVEREPADLRLALPFDGLYAGRSGAATVTATDSTGGEMSVPPLLWTSSDPSVATVDSAGRIRYLAAGRTVIEARTLHGTRVARPLAVLPIPVLRLGYHQRTLGVLQMDTLRFASTGTLLADSVAIEVSDSSVLDLPAATRLSAAVVPFHARRPGTTRIVLSGPGALPDTATVDVLPLRMQLVRDSLTTASDTVTVSAAVAFGVVFSDTLGGRRRLAEGIPVTYHVSGDSIFALMADETIPNYGSSLLEYRTTRAGAATITVTAPGFAPESLRVVATATARLLASPRVLLLGRGQTSRSQEVRIRRSDVGAAATVTLAQRHPELVTLPASLPYPENALWAAFDVTALGIGADTVVVSAPGFVPDTQIIVVTTPRIVTADTIVATQTGAVVAAVDLADSTGGLHVVTAPTTLLVRSSDTSVARPPARLDMRFVPGTMPGAKYLPLGPRAPGTATVTLTDSAGVAPPRAFTVRVVLDTTLRLATDSTQLTLGFRQRLPDNGWMLESAPVANGATIALTASDATVLSLPASLALGAFGLPVTVPLVGGDVPGAATVTASAVGFAPATSPRVEVGRPRVRLFLPTETYANSTLRVELQAVDQAGRTRVPTENVPVVLTSADPGLVAPGSPLLGSGNSTTWTDLRFLHPGVVHVVASDSRDVSWHYAPDTAIILVKPIPLAWAAPEIATVGVGQLLPLRLTWPEAFDVPLPGDSLRFASGVRLATPSARSMEPQTTIDVAGLAVGVDTLRTTAPERYDARPLRIVVTEGRVKLQGLQSQTAVGREQTITLVTQDQYGNERRVARTTAFDVTLDGPVAFSDARGRTRSVVLSAGASRSAGFRLEATGHGTATITVRQLDYQTGTGTITIP